MVHTGWTVVMGNIHTTHDMLILTFKKEWEKFHVLPHFLQEHRMHRILTKRLQIFIARCSNITFIKSFPHHIAFVSLAWSWACSTKEGCCLAGLGSWVWLNLQFCGVGWLVRRFPCHAAWTLSPKPESWAWSSAFALYGTEVTGCISSTYILNPFLTSSKQFSKSLVEIALHLQTKLGKPNRWATSQLWSDSRACLGIPGALASSHCGLCG